MQEFTISGAQLFFFCSWAMGCRCYEYYKLQNYGQNNHWVLMFVGNLKLKTYDTN